MPNLRARKTPVNMALFCGRAPALGEMCEFLGVLVGGEKGDFGGFGA